MFLYTLRVGERRGEIVLAYRWYLDRRVNCISTGMIYGQDRYRSVNYLFHDLITITVRKLVGLDNRNFHYRILTSLFTFPALYSTRRIVPFPGAVTEIRGTISYDNYSRNCSMHAAISRPRCLVLIATRVSRTTGNIFRVNSERNTRRDTDLVSRIFQASSATQKNEILTNVFASRYVTRGNEWNVTKRGDCIDNHTREREIIDEHHVAVRNITE